MTDEEPKKITIKLPIHVGQQIQFYGYWWRVARVGNELVLHFVKPTAAKKLKKRK